MTEEVKTPESAEQERDLSAEIEQLRAELKAEQEQRIAAEKAAAVEAQKKERILSTDSFTGAEKDMKASSAEEEAIIKKIKTLRIAHADECGKCDTLVVDVLKLGAPPYALQIPFTPEQQGEYGFDAYLVEFIEGKTRCPKFLAEILVGIGDKRYRIQN